MIHVCDLAINYGLLVVVEWTGVFHVSGYSVRDVTPIKTGVVVVVHSMSPVNKGSRDRGNSGSMMRNSMGTYGSRGRIHSTNHSIYEVVFYSSKVMGSTFCLPMGGRN